jgi:hypothetical protein
MTPELVPFLPILELRNAAALTRMAYEAEDLKPVIDQCEAGIAARIDSTTDWMDLGLLYQLVGHREHALACQAQGLTTHRIFRNRIAAPPKLKLLVFVTPGDLMTNTPIDLLLEGRPIDIIRLYVMPDQALPAQIPDHDLAFVAISEAEHTKPILAQLSAILPHWPRPVMNDPASILQLGRDKLFSLLTGAEGIVIPSTWRATADQIRASAASMLPLIVRPIDSHAGDRLELLQHPDHIAMYLSQGQETDYYLSPYVNYASADGGFRKYRIAFFDNKAHLAHLAIGDYWMVHYLNAGMADDAAKRREEAEIMATFDTGFGARHANAFTELMRRVGLDYFVVDCAETKTGELLIFEASVAMIVHALDSKTLYPYKDPNMQAMFAAFENRLVKSRYRVSESAQAG